MLILRHAYKSSFCFILIVLLRPPSAHALFQNDRFNKDAGNKQEYIYKPEKNDACMDYLFHKQCLYLGRIRNTMLHSGGNL